MARSDARRRPKLPPLLRWLTTLDLFVAVGAFVGGALLIYSPEGSALGIPLELLERSPFSDFFLPGLLLFFVVGGSAFLAGVAHLLRGRGAGQLSLLAGVILVGWIVVQALLIREVTGLHVLYFAIGVAQIALATRALGRATAS